MWVGGCGAVQHIVSASVTNTPCLIREKNTFICSDFLCESTVYETQPQTVLTLTRASLCFWKLHQSKRDVCFMANSVFRSNLFSSFTSFAKQVMDDGGGAGGNNRSAPAWFHFHPIMDETAWKLKASTLWRANPSGWIILCKLCLVYSSWVINNFRALIPQAGDDIVHLSWTARLTVSYQGGGTRHVQSQISMLWRSCPQEQSFRNYQKHIFLCTLFSWLHAVAK